MTQRLDKKPMTSDFVDIKEAIQDALKQGYKWYKEAGIMDWKVKVMKSDPQGPADLPAVGINRTSDGEINQALGDAFAYERDNDIDRTVKKYGTNFRETVEVKIWTTNSDQRDLLYSITKAILFEYRHYLALRYGLVNQNIIGGRDEANHIQYQGHFMYWGVITFQAENSIQMNIFAPSITEVSVNQTAIPVSSVSEDDI